MKKYLKDNLYALGINELAIFWLLDLWNVIQEIDDIADKGSCDYKNLAQKIFNTIPNNPWYQANIKNLAPLLTTQMYKWFAANEMESKKEDIEKAYMLRAGYYDIVLYVVSLHGIIEKPEVIYKIYGEKYSKYLKEIENA